MKIFSVGKVPILTRGIHCLDSAVCGGQMAGVALSAWHCAWLWYADARSQKFIAVKCLSNYISRES